MSEILKRIEKGNRKNIMVECRCECGATRVTRKGRCTAASKCSSCAGTKKNSYAINNGVIHMDVSTEKFPNTTTFFDACFLDLVVDGKGRWFAADFCKGVIYVVRSKKGEKLHRYILQPKENNIVDHVDGNGLNNLLKNIRITSNLENSRNKAISSRNNTGVLGVHKHSEIDKFVAQISNGIKTIHIGCFDTIEEAAKARKKAMIEYGYAPEHGTRSVLR